MNADRAAVAVLQARTEPSGPAPRHGDRPQPTGWQCGLTDEAGHHADGRCRDVVPELIVELL